MNPDLSPKHVGMQWSIVDASELVRPNDAQMRDKYSLTQTSFPLFKAYNTFENSGMTYEQRMNQYEGPTDHLISPMQRTSQFIDYTNSGGITKKNDMVQNIYEIQQKIIRAKEIKGALCLNNANAYGGSWRTPALDLAFQNKHGGETGQRFYSKFPIYRPRGKQPPDV